MEKVVSKLKVINLKSVLKFTLMFVLFFVCSKASINQGYLTPFVLEPTMHWFLKVNKVIWLA